MSKELRIGVPGSGPGSGATAFAVSRDSAGILIGVRDNAAPQFAVSRDSAGLLLSVLPAPVVAHTYTVHESYYAESYRHVRLWGYGGGISQAAYEAVRAGSASAQTSPDYVVGQGVESYYTIRQPYLLFDTDVIPAGEVVIGATLTMDCNVADQSETDFIIEARVYNCGPTIEESDYVAGDDLAGKPLFATFDTALLVPGPGQPTLFTEATGAAAAINPSGVTGLLLCSDQTRLNVAPTTVDFVTFFYGGGERPYLTLTTSGPG